MGLRQVKNKATSLKDSLKKFHAETLGFLSRKLSKIDHFTTEKGSIC